MRHDFARLSRDRGTARHNAFLRAFLTGFSDGVPRGARGREAADHMQEAQRYVLFYESGDLSLAAEHFPAHRARYTEFMNRGVLLALGPFTDRSGSIAIFSTHEAAMDFASGDPFVEHGVVSGWQVREWRVVTPE
jgi:uncharacterized protein YciI